MGAVTLGIQSSVLRSRRSLDRVGTDLQRSYERLSTGMRINRASDDAAGLAIADRLRTDARLFSTAARNVSDGVSLLNIVDSTLENQSGVLMRLAELAQQAASGSLSSTQRAALSSEYQQLVQEYGRLGDSAQFNGQNLLKSYGSSLNFNLQVGTTGSATSGLGFSIRDGGSFSGRINFNALPGYAGSAQGSLESLSSFYNGNLANVSVVDSSGRKRELLIGISAGVDENGSLRPSFNVYARNSDIVAIGSSNTWSLVSSGYAGAIQSNGQTSGSVTIGLAFAGGTSTASLSLDVRGLSFSSGHSPYSTIVNAVRQAVADRSGMSLDDLPESTHFAKSLGWDSIDLAELTLAIEESLNINIPDSVEPGEDISTIGALAKYIFDLQDPQYAAAAGTQTSVAFTSIDSASQARTALTVVQARLAEISTQRGELGAVQSRLQSSANLLSVKRETSKAAESRIRDVDVATETANLVSRQIRQQTASAVLRQASVQPQLALRLLENI